VNQVQGSIQRLLVGKKRQSWPSRSPVVAGYISSDFMVYRKLAETAEARLWRVRRSAVAAASAAGNLSYWISGKGSGNPAAA